MFEEKPLGCILLSRNDGEGAPMASRFLAIAAVLAAVAARPQRPTPTTNWPSPSINRI
jgi:hypothetical protein